MKKRGGGAPGPRAGGGWSLHAEVDSLCLGHCRQLFDGSAQVFYLVVRVNPMRLDIRVPGELLPDFRRNTRVRQLRNKGMAQSVECLTVTGAALALTSNDTPTIPALATIARNCADKPLPPLRGWQATAGNTGPYLCLAAFGIARFRDHHALAGRPACRSFSSRRE